MGFLFCPPLYCNYGIIGQHGRGVKSKLTLCWSVPKASQLQECCCTAEHHPRPFCRVKGQSCCLHYYYSFNIISMAFLSWIEFSSSMSCCLRSSLLLTMWPNDWDQHLQHDMNREDLWTGPVLGWKGFYSADVRFNWLFNSSSLISYSLKLQSRGNAYTHHVPPEISCFNLSSYYKVTSNFDCTFSSTVISSWYIWTNQGGSKQTEGGRGMPCLFRKQNPALQTALIKSNLKHSKSPLQHFLNVWWVHSAEISL